MTIETLLTILTFLLLCFLIVSMLKLQAEYERALLLMQRTIDAENY